MSLEEEVNRCRSYLVNTYFQILCSIAKMVVRYNI